MTSHGKLVGYGLITGQVLFWTFGFINTIGTTSPDPVTAGEATGSLVVLLVSLAMTAWAGYLIRGER